MSRHVLIASMMVMTTVAVAGVGTSQAMEAQKSIVPTHESSSTADPMLDAMPGDHGDTPDGHTQTEHTPDAHTHERVEVPVDLPVPTINLVVHPDARQGWNLEVQVTHFQFAPDRVNVASSPTEGHAHLYIDGTKITRLYSNWYYLGELPSGRHEITVNLNTNTHATLTHDGQPIQATVVVDVP